jgi:hypothetical protein
MLTAWGMHRMGPKGSKMRAFNIFSESIKQVWSRIIPLQEKECGTLSAEDWIELKGIFFDLTVMRSKTSLVGNSKVMAHALPNLIPPVDRQYTLSYLYGNGNIKNDLEWEWKRLEEMLTHFFYPIRENNVFIRNADKWLQEKARFPWDTSHLKIIDNLIIGLANTRKK